MDSIFATAATFVPWYYSTEDVIASLVGSLKQFVDKVIPTLNEEDAICSAFLILEYKKNQNVRLEVSASGLDLRFNND